MQPNDTFFSASICDLRSMSLGRHKEQRRVQFGYTTRKGRETALTSAGVQVSDQPRAQTTRIQSMQKAVDAKYIAMTESSNSHRA